MGSGALRLLANLKRKMLAPISTILCKLDERRRRAERASIWNAKKVAHRIVSTSDDLIQKIVLSDDHLCESTAADRTHILILMMYNKLIDEIQEMPKCLQRDAHIIRGIGPIISAITNHFLVEEAAMLKANYPNLLRHRFQHDDFISTIHRMINQIDQGDVSYEQLLFYIGAWISGHVLISDWDFSEFYKRKLALDAS